MENFIAFNPVRLFFGDLLSANLAQTIKQYGRKVLLITGKGSVKQFGYFDEVMSLLNDGDIEIIEYSGIKSNPVIEDVRAAVKVGKENRVEVVLALGGGSVIDSAKIISLGLKTSLDPWDFMTWKEKPTDVAPLITILTLAATGTEMNAAAVVQDNSTGEKLGFVNELIFPKASFLNPAFTVSVPRNYTAFGIVDLIAHALEAYFGAGEPSLTDRIVFSIIKDAMYWAPRLLNDPSNIEYRANIMLDATLALNGLTNYGKRSGDWGVHSLGHELSLLFDTPHGASLSIVYPAWMKLKKREVFGRIKKLGQALFETDSVDETILSFEEFFTSIGSPIRLTEIGLSSDNLDSIMHQYMQNKVSGMNHPLQEDDYSQLIKLMQ